MFVGKYDDIIFYKSLEGYKLEIGDNGFSLIIK